MSERTLENSDVEMQQNPCSAYCICQMHKTLRGVYCVIYLTLTYCAQQMVPGSFMVLYVELVETAFWKATLREPKLLYLHPGAGN